LFYSSCSIQIFKNIWKIYLIIRVISIVSKLCIEFGRKNCFYFVYKFIYHNTFFEINNITLCAEPSFFIFYIFCVEFTIFVCWTPLPVPEGIGLIQAKGARLRVGGGQGNHEPGRNWWDQGQVGGGERGEWEVDAEAGLEPGFVGW